MDLEPLYLYILSQIGIKSLEEYNQLRDTFGSFENIHQATNSQLQKAKWRPERIALWEKTKDKWQINPLVRKIEDNHITVLPYFIEDYPTALKQLFDPPAVLFCRGTLSVTNTICIGIVGTRQITSYGKTIVPHIISPLVMSNCIIISGLAYGIDAAAHAATVKQNGTTVAVLGSGVDSASIYPRQHTALAEQIIASGGCLISEYAPGTLPRKHHFVARNRIIAALSCGVVIVECKSKSGALITADYALDLGRHVWAIPGPAYSALSEGPHKLIQQGATLITNGSDITQQLGITITKATNGNKIYTQEEQRMLECMQSSPATIDVIQQTTKLPIDLIAAAITNLELSGVIQNTGTEGFIITHCMDRIETTT